MWKAVNFLKAVTGFDYKINDLYTIADRIYTLIRSYWIREFDSWNREMDTPPDRWFTEETSIGPFKGSKLNKTSYNIMLDWYYEERGWTKNGIPKESTLYNLGLNYVSKELKGSS